MKKNWLLLLLLPFVWVNLFTISATVQANTTLTKDVQAEWWWNKERNPERQIPPLEGGPENTERVQLPVSNIILQQMYPNTVFLQGDPASRQVALTFDDGPDPRFTEDVLDVLAQYDVPATFFLMGSRAIAYPEIVQRMQAEGHIIGNHTYWHPNLVREGDLATLDREISRTEDTLNDIVGYRTSLFRAPYGFLYDALVERVAELNYNVIAWSVDSLDWQEQGADTIAYTVLSNLHPGAIILMHDGGDWDADRTGTVEALHQIIPAIRAQGLEFVTVDELLNLPYQK